MFTKYIRTGSATATASAYRKVTDWDTVLGTIFIVVIVLALIAA